MNQSLILPALLTIALLSPASARTEELRGKVAKITTDTVEVSLDSAFVPNVGDKAEVVEEIPGLDDVASVASGKVAEVSDAVIVVKIDRATGKVAKGQLVNISSDKPRKKGLAERQNSVDLSGDWIIDDGTSGYPAKLTQVGNRVTGTYELAGGKIEGVLGSLTFTLRWHQPDNKRGGTSRLTLAADGRTMTGDWAYDPNAYDSGLTGEGQWTWRRAGASSTNGPLLLADDFDTEKPHAVPLFDQSFMSLSNQLGEAWFTVTGKQGVFPAFYPQFQAKDFIAEVDFRVTTLDTNNGYGILFRYPSDPNNSLAYYAVFVTPDRQDVSLAAWQATKWAAIKAAKLPGDLYRPARANKLRLEAVGDTFRVFLNGTFVLEGRDASIAGAGKFGLCVAKADERPDTVHFDNLRIYEPAGTSTVPPQADGRMSANGRELLADDFDTENPRAVPLFDQSFMSLSNQLGEAWFSVPGKVGVATALYPDFKAKDFIAEVDFRVVSLETNNSYGIVFRYPDATNDGLAYYALFVTADREEIYMAAWLQTKWTAIRQAKLPRDLYRPAKANRLRVEAVRDTFRVFLNGTLVLEGKDASIAGAGMFGLCLSKVAEKPDTVHFDNLRVYEPAP